jgi:hypothetical protein
MRSTPSRTTRPAIGNPERMSLSGVLDPEDMTIHRQEYTAIDADALSEFPRYVCRGREEISGQAHHREHRGGLKHRETR